MDQVAYVQHTCIKYLGMFQHLGLLIGDVRFARKSTVLFTNTINIDLIKVNVNNLVIFVSLYEMNEMKSAMI